MERPFSVILLASLYSIPTVCCLFTLTLTPETHIRSMECVNRPRHCGIQYTRHTLRAIGSVYLDSPLRNSPDSFATLDWSRQSKLFRKTRRKARGGQRRKIHTLSNVFDRVETKSGGVNQNNLISLSQIQTRGHNIPSIITGNARSLNNKLEELEALAKFDPNFYTTSLLCFSETWFTEVTPESITSITGFSVHRGDRDLLAVNKDCGGGVCAFVNDIWCNKKNVHKKIDICTPDLELLALSLRPHYLPREFSLVLLVCVYIPCRANTHVSMTTLASHILDLENSHPDAFLVITGDFNNRTLSKVLPSYRQQVKCHTREQKTIDLCYSKIKDAYTSSKVAPLGRSDHNLVRLTPKYTPKVKKEPPKRLTIKQWTREAIDELNDCFDCTEWSTFVDTACDLNELTMTVCDYINFCIDICVPQKTITIYQNNKPWLNKRIKLCLNEKSRAYKTGDKDKLKTAEKNLRREIRRGKREYKNELEEKFRLGGAKQLWEGLEAMTGYQNKKKKKEQFVPDVTDIVGYANELNKFYARFDKHDFTKELNELKCELNKQNDVDPIELTEHEVRNAFKRINRRKGAGPDGIHPKVIGHCYDALSSIFTLIFNLSLKSCCVPQIWKTSCIIPVPKKPTCTVMNDLRPIAMTSAVMKVLERLLLSKLQPLVVDFIDPLQFAYVKNRGVEDAILFVLDNIYKHLDKKDSYIRMMFFDFSSAFNTIQPHLMGAKLTNMSINPKTILWVIAYLTNRPQYVNFPGNCSRVITTNTGAPQGTVLSPFLFSLYTSDCRLSDNMDGNQACPMVKYADDTSLCGLIQNDNEREYRDGIEKFVQWCDENYLLLNVTKTKEMIVDFRKLKNPEVKSPISIRNENVEIINEYKYLGLTFDSQLTWYQNTTLLIRKCQSRLFFLRRLKSFGANATILKNFYMAIVHSIVSFCAVCWGGNISASDVDRINQIIRKAGKAIGEEQKDFGTFLKERDLIKMENVIKDETHPLHPEFTSRQSVSGRFRLPKIKTERYRGTFIPRSISQFNRNFKR